MADLIAHPSSLALAALILLGGWIVTAVIGGAVVARFVRPYQDAMLPEGLPGGGRTIGLLERTMILLLILAGEPGGVGFLIAAKSILRFDVGTKSRDADPEIRKQAQQASEYVIIGTLASFAWAFAASFLTVELLELIRP